MAWHDGLTGPALQIAQVAATNLRVMAGPGTGKSFAMKRRIHRLLEEGVNPQKILALTFTRVSGRDLVKELKALGVEGCESIRASTLHAYCFSVLAKRSVLSFSGRVARPIQADKTSGVLQFEAGPMLADIQTGQFGTKRDLTKRIIAFESAWARLQSDVAGWPLDPTDKAFHAALLNWMKFHQGMLIGELVPETLRYLRNNPTAEELSEFEHVIVDEYQDLNKADQELINLLATNSESLIIGDADQSIYTFRHAHPEGINDYHLTHTDTHDESLDECRRCPTKVVELADNLIKQNYPAGSAARLKPLAGNPEGEVHIVQWTNPDEEVSGTASFISHLISTGRYSPSDILVLSHRRKFGYELRDKLHELSIPAHSFFPEKVLDDKQIQLAYSLLTLLTNPEDRIALRFWLGTGSPSYNKAQYAVLRNYCEANGLSPREALVKAVAGENIGRVPKLVAKFVELETIASDYSKLSVKDVFNKLFPENEDWCLEMREKIFDKIDDDFTLEELRPLIDSTVLHPDPPEDGSAVRIMSPHGSKGLTSKVVIVMNCVQGIIPHTDNSKPPAEQEASLREQRRLFYVAITRPTELLLLSSYASIELSVAHRVRTHITRRTHITPAVTSQFIDELGSTAPAVKNGTDWLTNGFQ